MVEKASQSPVITNVSVMDIEDLVELGRKCAFCPYYMARQLKNTSDIVFMPYNYLLDPRTSKNMDVEIYGNVIIFDEAHNIEKICEDSVSVQIKSSDIKSAVDDIEAILALMEMKRVDIDWIPFTQEDLETLRQMLMTFYSEINSISLVKLSQAGTVFDGDYIYKILEKSEVECF